MLKDSREDILFQDYTKYSFKGEGGHLYLISHGREGNEHVELPYNHGKFCEAEYYKAAGPGHFWDWLRISRKERKEFKQFMQTYKEPLSISDFRKMQMNYDECDVCCETPIKKKKSLSELAPLLSAVPNSFQTIGGTWISPCGEPMSYGQQEGKIPMRYNENSACANATVQSQPSDTAVTRDYLLKRLASADYPKDCELRKFFNLYVDNTPKTYKEMIDIIKAGTYTLDAKMVAKVDANTLEQEDEGDYCCFGPFYGIIWPGPQSDHKGFEAAIKEKTKQYTAAKDIIMVDVFSAGLKAIQDFEAWLPTPATPIS